MLGSGQGCSWGTGECVSGAWGCFGVFSGVLGLFEGVGGLRGVSGSLLPSFPFNVRKSQMRILNFFSRPEDPKCLKYQNVPNLGSFWAIGKPWERFQSWDIRIYFIPVPKDHTVARVCHRRAAGNLRKHWCEEQTDRSVTFPLVTPGSGDMQTCGHPISLRSKDL